MKIYFDFLRWTENWSFGWSVWTVRGIAQTFRCRFLFFKPPSLSLPWPPFAWDFSGRLENGYWEVAIIAALTIKLRVFLQWNSVFYFSDFSLTLFVILLTTIIWSLLVTFSKTWMAYFCVGFHIHCAKNGSCQQLVYWYGQEGARSWTFPSGFCRFPLATHLSSFRHT